MQTLVMQTSTTPWSAKKSGRILFAIIWSTIFALFVTRTNSQQTNSKLFQLSLSNAYAHMPVCMVKGVMWSGAAYYH